MVTAFERDVLKVVELMAHHDPGVVVVLNEDRRVIFVGGEAAQCLSDVITAGGHIYSTPFADNTEFEMFIDAIIHSESSFSGKFRNLMENGIGINWHGDLLDESGFILLRGNVLDNSRKPFYKSSFELESLMEKERMLSTLLGNLPGMAYRCRNDLDRTMDFVSEGCLELTGYRSESLIENREISFADLIPPEYRAHVWECVQEAVQERFPYEIIYKIKVCSGEDKWVWEKGVDVNPRGEAVVLEGFIADVTPLMMAEQALHKSEERYRLMAEKTGQMVYDYKIETGEVIWGGAVVDISGCSVREFQSVDIEGWTQLIHPEDRSAVRNELESCISEKRSFFLFTGLDVKMAVTCMLRKKVIFFWMPEVRRFVWSEPLKNILTR